MTLSVRKTKLPHESQLHARVSPDDFLDCYTVASRLTAPEAAEIIVDFPGWAKALVALRNIATSPFGLRNDGPEAVQKLGLFPIDITTDTEVIAGFDDKHLDFRVSVFSKAGEVFLATWVHPHNLGGRLYLATILPFHILIARNALARVASSTEPGPYDPLPE